MPGGPGHGPTLRTPSNAQVFPGRSNGQQWGNILVSTGVNVDTQQGIQYGNITYSAIESNSDYWAEFGRYGEIKNLFEGCTAVFFTDGVVLGPPDVPLDPNHNIYYTIGNYTGGYVIVRYAFGNVNMVINDFSIARGDFLNVDRAYAGITVTHPSWGTLIQVTNSGTISLYGVTLNASDVDRS